MLHNSRRQTPNQSANCREATWLLRRSEAYNLEHNKTQRIDDVNIAMHLECTSLRMTVIHTDPTDNVCLIRLRWPFIKDFTWVDKSNYDDFTRVDKSNYDDFTRVDKSQ